jgi:hypothetical protein
MALRFCLAFFILFCLSLVSLSCRSRSAELDKEISDRMLQSFLASAMKKCDKDALSKEDCERLKEKTIETYRPQIEKTISDVNRNCKFDNLSEDDCNVQKEKILGYRK